MASGYIYIHDIINKQERIYISPAVLINCKNNEVQKYITKI